MKKKTLALLLAVSCTLSMAACGASGDGASSSSRADEARAELAKEFSEEEDVTDDKPDKEEEIEDEEETKGEGTDKKAVTPPSVLSDDLYDFQISIDGTVYQFPMWYSDFEALGWEYEDDPTEVLSANQHTGMNKRWSKDGIEVYTLFANQSINSAPLSESIVAGMIIDRYNFSDCDWEIMLPGGIQWGVSNTDDIIAAYGDPVYDFDSDMYYEATYVQDSFQSIGLAVFKEEDALLKIELVNIEELEGADNSVDETVPDLVKQYKAPSSLGDDFYAYTVQLEGIVYSLPCPVSVFMENGFTIDADSSDEVIASGGTGWISLQYNNHTLPTTVKNYADYATTIENCFVTQLSITIYGSELDMVFPGNIKVGDSEDVLKKVIDGFNYEEMVMEETGFYQIYNPDKSLLDCYIFMVEDGSIISMQVENSEEPEY